MPLQKIYNFDMHQILWFGQHGITILWFSQYQCVSAQIIVLLCFTLLWFSVIILIVATYIMHLAIALKTT